MAIRPYKGGAVEHDNIQIEDLPVELAGIAEVIGLPAVLQLVEIYGGEAIYINKRESVYRAARDRQIRAEFNGRNYRELAQEYGLTVSMVRQIVGSVEPRQKQLTLFGEE